MSSTHTDAPVTPDAGSPLVRSRKRYGDALFRWVSTTSGSMILVILAAVAIFLIAASLPVLTASKEELQQAQEVGFWAWVAPYAFGTVWIAFLAMLVAVPVSVGIALFISHYAPRKLAAGLGYMVDLLSAVPSVVFGLWGIKVFAPLTTDLYKWMQGTFGGVPVLEWFFGAGPSATGRTVLTAALVLAVMVLPIITAISREVFLQTPRLHEEASLALGATRWEMIRQAVLPFGTPGIVSACMLGLGRALGETMAVAMVLSGSDHISFQLLSSSTKDTTNTIAANIAQSRSEAHDIGLNELVATGLILFVITLVVNMIARAIIARRAEFSGANS